VPVVSIAASMITLLLWKVRAIFAKPVPDWEATALRHTTSCGSHKLHATSEGFHRCLSSAAFFVLKVVYARNGAYCIDSVMLRIPVIGMLLRKIGVAVFHNSHSVN